MKAKNKINVFFKILFRTKSLKFLIFICSLFFLIFGLNESYGAEKSGGVLFLHPKSGIHAVGDVFSVQVLIDSGGQEINAAEAEIDFNPDELLVESISTDGSVFSLWPIGPKFSNVSGTIDFAGGSKEKFIGERGLMLTITFKALRSNVSRTNLVAGAILAADGVASNIITSMRSGVYTLKPEQVLAQPEYLESDLPPVPEVVSDTHPDQNSWYKERKAEFSWKLPEDVTVLKLLVGSKPESAPTIIYDPPINRKEIGSIIDEDGVYYFHAQMKNQFGWGKTAHFRFQIDTEDPERFEITEQEDTNIFDAKAEIFFDAVDNLSGIEKYEIKIDGRKEAIVWRDDGSHIYKTPSLEQGDHVLLVKAIDGAGNYVWATSTFNIESYGPPVFIEYPKTINISEGEILTVKGKTVPNSVVRLWLQRNSEPETKYRILSNEKGIFSFSQEEFDGGGVYYLRAKTYAENETESLFSEKISFKVESTGFKKLFDSPMFEIFLVVISLTTAVLMASLFLAYVWHKTGQPKKQPKRRTNKRNKR